MFTAVGPGQLGFRLGTDAANHTDSQLLRPLAQDQADPAGGGIHQDGVAGLDRVGAE